MIKKLVLASSMFLASCTTLQVKPKLNTCEQSFEDLNNLYTLIEPFYGIDSCSTFNSTPIFKVLEVVKAIKRKSLECTDIIDNIEDVADPVLDYVKRSIFHVDLALELVKSNAYPSKIDRLSQEMFVLKSCYTQLESIRMYYKLNELDFGVDTIVYKYLLDKIHEVDSLLVNSNFIFCTE